MLRRSDKGGLCVNCAVHDWLRNTYPVNQILAGMKNPQCLLLPYLQDQFISIMKVGNADAVPDEINWQAIVDNWDLPWPFKVNPSAMNPMSQKMLDLEPRRRVIESKKIRDQCEGVKSKEQIEYEWHEALDKLFNPEYEDI